MARSGERADGAHLRPGVDRVEGSERIRRRIRARYEIHGENAFDLLEAIGRDCVGALQLLPDEESPKGVTTISATPLSSAEVEKVLLGTLSENPFRADDDDLRISIA